ncbi:hypothetical protein B0H17DRAFT_948004, partial [Mycena rosella]
QIQVFGNIVNGQRIAAIIYIVQQSTQVLQGFITSINTANGHFFVSNVEFVLNDPLGRFGLPYTANSLWTVDPDNPSVRASTGSPLCIPRSTKDADCPASNRPTDPATGKSATSFTFKAPATVVAGADPDPRLMVPLVVGDYVTFSGTKVVGSLIEVCDCRRSTSPYTDYAIHCR